MNHRCISEFDSGAASQANVPSASIRGIRKRSESRIRCAPILRVVVEATSNTNRAIVRFRTCGSAANGPSFKASRAAACVKFAVGATVLRAIASSAFAKLEAPAAVRRWPTLAFTDPSGTVRPVGTILDGVYADGTENDKIIHYYYKYLNAGGWGVHRLR